MQNQKLGNYSNALAKNLAIPGMASNLSLIGGYIMPMLDMKQGKLDSHT
jgi:hypothetical protein